MSFSSRTQFDRRENRLADALSRRAGAGRTHLDLTVGNPTRARLPYATTAILEALADERALVYEPEPFGLPAARDAIARLWASRGISVEPSRVVLTASSSEAYAFLFKVLCDPGDAVLVPRPSYPLFEHLSRFEGVRAVPYDLRYDGAWHLDRDSVRRARTESTRAIVVVSPNNPTSSYLKRDELEFLNDVGLPIVSDEVFGDYHGAGATDRVVSALENARVPVFVLDGLSKLAALPQMKLSWITASGPDALVGEVLGRLELVCDAFLSPSAVVQHALPALLAASATTRAAIKRRLATNHAALVTAAAGATITPLAYEGGWYAVVQLPNLRPEEDWVLGLLEDRDVLAQPGFFYDFLNEPFLVLSLLTEEHVFAEGVRRIVQYAAEG